MFEINSWQFFNMLFWLPMHILQKQIFGLNLSQSSSNVSIFNSFEVAQPVTVVNPNNTTELVSWITVQKIFKVSLLRFHFPKVVCNFLVFPFKELNLNHFKIKSITVVGTCKVISQDLVGLRLCWRVFRIQLCLFVHLSVRPSVIPFSQNWFITFF